MTDEEILLGKRFLELARKSDDRGVYFFSDFLGLGEQAVFHALGKEISRYPVTAFGGADGCERVMLRFGSPEEIGYEIPFPIVLLKIAAKDPKFSDVFTHRDFLGAVLNLGIDRAKLGDIVIRENAGYLFAAESIAPFIESELLRVKHTAVTVSAPDALPEGELFHLRRVIVQVSGERLDAVIAKVFKLSREEAQSYFSKRLVFVGGKEIGSPSYTPKEGDVVSVRTLGRMIYRGPESLSKKGKLNTAVDLFE